MPAPVSSDLYVLSREDGRRLFHLGLSGDLSKDGDPKKPHHLPPYSDGTLNFTNGQYWNSQATDRTNCPVVIRVSPARIVAAKRMFPFGDAGYGISSAPTYADYKGPMDAAWVTGYMPTTGDRPDIGLITDPSAYFMMGQSPDGMLAAAYAAGSFPMHYRDETTDRPIDLLKYFKANTNDAPGWGPPWLPRFPLNADGSANIGGGLYPQQAHYPELSYLAHEATLDLGFLEDLQYSANFTLLCDAAKSNPAGIAIVSGEIRGIAWASRNLFMAHIATKDAEARLAAEGMAWPTWLHPSSYYKTILDNNLAYYSKIMADPTNQVFRLIFGTVTIFTPWQCDFELSVLAFAVLTGHDDWAPLYLWALKNVIDRAAGDRGYPLGMGGGVYFDSKQPSWAAALANLYMHAAIPGDFFYDTRFTAEQLASLQADPNQGYKTLYDSSPHLNTRAVLVMAQYLHKLGLVDVKAVYPELDACVATMNKFVKNVGYITAKTSVVLDAAGVPDTFPPVVTPPVEVPPTQPPQGEIHMSETKFTIAPGQTKQLDFLDDAGQPAVLAGTPTIEQTDPGVFSLQLNAQGVLASATAPGDSKITVKAQGASGVLIATSVGTVAVPLSSSLNLVPRD